MTQIYFLIALVTISLTSASTSLDLQGPSKSPTSHDDPSTDSKPFRLSQLLPLPLEGLHRARSASRGQRSNPSYHSLTLPPVPLQITHQTATVVGLRVEEVDKGVTYTEGVSVILSDVLVSIRLYGRRFTNYTIIRFTTELNQRGEDCDDVESTRKYTIDSVSDDGTTALISISFPPGAKTHYICAREDNFDMPWVHQGPDQLVTIKTYQIFLPLWVQILFIIILLTLSGLFAGLTLGLLSLDQTDLKILANTGDERERAYARTILPLRSRGNYLLCSLVLGNVLVNSTLTILMDDLTTGVLAILISTMGIVVFGEILPQAVCSRFGLAIGAKTVYLTKFLMFISFPLSGLFSWALDKILGKEIGLVYNRERLKELIAVTLEHNDLEIDEVNIISGALEMRKKTVMDIMTKLEDIFMLPAEGILDCETLGEIRKQGYSRIPVFEGSRSNIVSLLLTKDLVFVDPEDGLPLRTLTQFYNNPCFFVLAPTTLDVVLKQFKAGDKGHMAFVQKINSSQPDRDPYCETIGIVTMEDVIEELIQAEIVDETDVSRSGGKLLLDKGNFLAGRQLALMREGALKRVLVSPKTTPRSEDLHGQDRESRERSISSSLNNNPT